MPILCKDNKTMINNYDDLLKEYGRKSLNDNSNHKKGDFFIPVEDIANEFIETLHFNFKIE